MTPAEVLAAVERWPSDLRALWEERCALVQYGCGVSRETSELMAYRLLAPQAPLKQVELKLEAKP